MRWDLAKYTYVVGSNAERGSKKMKPVTSCIVSILALAAAPSALAFMHDGNGAPKQRRAIDRQKNLDTALHLYRSAQEAIADAERICAEEGMQSERCKVAWDIVEELEAADSHVRAPQAEQHELSYSPLVNGLDILVSKIDRKLDELKNLSAQLADAGAGPEVERLIYASEEMKEILEVANRSLDQYRYE